MPFQTHWVSSTAHLSCQPQSCFSMHGSTWALTAQGRFMAQGRLTEKLPQAETVSIQAFKADNFIARTWLHQPWALAAQGGWVQWGRARKDPCSTSRQLGAVQNSSQEPGWQKCWARETPQAAELPVTDEGRLVQKGCWNLEPEGESRHGFLI